MIARAPIAFAAMMCVVSVDAAIGQPLTIRYGAAFSMMRSIYALPIVVGQREGLFAKEGLNLDIVVPMPGGSDKMIAALHDDTVDITHVATPFLIRAALAGSDAVAIAAEFNNPIYSLVAKPGIKSFADLKGRLVGLADEAGSIAISTRKLMALHGLEAGDFRVRTAVGTPGRLACLQNGDCDAVPLGQPQDLVAEEAGYRVLGLSTEAVPDFVYTVTAVRRSWAEKNKETVVRYVRALAAAFRFIRDPANRAEVVKIIVDALGVSPAIAQKTMALYLDPDRGVLPQQGEVSGKGLANVIAMMGQAGLLQTPLPKPDRFVDRQYLEAAGVRRP